MPETSAPAAKRRWIVSMSPLFVGSRSALGSAAAPWKRAPRSANQSSSEVLPVITAWSSAPNPFSSTAMKSSDPATRPKRSSLRMFAEPAALPLRARIRSSSGRAERNTEHKAGFPAARDHAESLGGPFFCPSSSCPSSSCPSFSCASSIFSSVSACRCSSFSIASTTSPAVMRCCRGLRRAPCLMSTLTVASLLERTPSMSSVGDSEIARPSTPSSAELAMAAKTLETMSRMNPKRSASALRQTMKSSLRTPALSSVCPCSKSICKQTSCTAATACNGASQPLTSRGSPPAPASRSTRKFSW
mmetsp:Transcript_14498/g.32251  ORF Transcript_14498/g.32251 Transcript_14498/m.32251 type:complete len:303 (-) Transcript_14498:226-1134(-)